MQSHKINMVVFSQLTLAISAVLILPFHVIHMNSVLETRLSSNVGQL